MGPTLLTLSLMTLSLLVALPIGMLWGWSVFQLQLQHQGAGPLRTAASLFGAAAMVAMVVMLALPLYVHAAGWEGTAGKFGWVPLIPGKQRFWFHGLMATAWIHGAYGACWVALATTVALRRIPESIVQASLVDTSRFCRQRHVYLPLAMPWVTAAAIWTALVAATDMTVANLYGVSTLADAVYKIYALDPEPLPVVASVLLPSLVLVPIVVWIVSRNRRFQWAARGVGEAEPASIHATPRGPGATIYAGGQTGGLDAWSAWGAILLVVVAVLLTLLLTAVPLVSLVLKAGWTVTQEGGRLVHDFSPLHALHTLRQSFSVFGREFAWSGQLVMYVVLVSVPLGWRAAAWCDRRPRRGSLLMAAMLIAILIPGPVVSLLVIQLFNRPLLGWLYTDTLVPTIVALLPKTIPLAFLVLRGGYRMLDRNVNDCARLDGCGPITRILRVDGPRLRPALVLACLTVALVTLADVSSTILVLPPSVVTVASRLFGLLHSGVRNQEAGLALLVTIVAGTVTLVVTIWLRFASRGSRMFGFKHIFPIALGLLACGSWPGAAAAVEHIVFRPSADSDQVLEIVGESLVTAADGGMLILADDGQLWTVQPERVVSRSHDDRPLVPISRDDAAAQMLKRLPPGFQVHRTVHYVICHNTTDEYVEWVGGLFEQAYTGFYAFWGNKGHRLPEAEFPLMAVVFADQRSFAEFARPEVGDLVDSVIGYYNLQTNRMMTFYLDNSERRVATLVHEAVHQLAYNSGLQRRMADNPYWVSEGLATYFETPDSSARGWRSIGGVNQVNLARFHNYLATRPPDSLTTLIRDDSRFRNPADATAAYAEAWALNYFLIRTKQKEYLRYLDALAKGPLLRDPDPRARVQAFQDAMGMDLETLDRQFLQYIYRHVGRRR